MAQEKITEQARKQLAGLKKRIKNENDSFKEAIKRAMRTGKDEYSIEEILKFDNEVRAEYGLPRLKAYPIILNEYRPSTKEESWKKFLGVKVKRVEGRLPEAVELYEECEGISDAVGMDRVEEEALALYRQLFPQSTEIDKKQLTFCRNSVIQKHELELAGISSDKGDEIKD